MTLPYLTSELPGVGGSIKQRPEDFFVQELPLYEPAGEGEHVYVEIQKTGLTTFDAIEQLADALSISPREIGYAGLKDAHAVTRQILSLWGTTEQKASEVSLPNVSVLWARRHINKLRVGHLRGNRFAIKIRGVEPSAAIRAKPVLDRLSLVGMPNYFGEQRFGRRNNNDLLGAALLRNDNPSLLKLLLGGPDPRLDEPRLIQARRAFDSNNFELAMKLLPRSSGMERRVLARFLKTRKAGAAIKTIDQRLRRLWISALQSRIFNEVAAARLPGGLDHLLAGDLAYLHDHGAVFKVEDLAAEQPRADRFEISPTGPLIGYRCSMPDGAPLEIEQATFEKFGLKPADFRGEGRDKVKGARRPLRVRPSEVQIEGGADAFGPYLLTAFTLPAGSFATVLLREVMKDSDPDSEESDSTGEAGAETASD